MRQKFIFGSVLLGIISIISLESFSVCHFLEASSYVVVINGDSNFGATNSGRMLL